MNNKDDRSNDVNEEKELDELFTNFKDNKLKKAVKKAKRQSIIRNTIISFLVVVLVIIAGSLLNRNLVYKLEGPVQIAADSFNEISAPNEYIGKTDRYHGFLGGENRYTTYKIINGKIVYTGEDGYHYGLFQNYQGNWIGSEWPSIIGPSYDAEEINVQKYNELGQREMLFFYPFISYPEYKNDLKLLDEMEATKQMEIALSFDKGYSMDEVAEMLPNDVTLAWYWIDDSNEQEKEASKAFDQEQLNENGEQIVITNPPKLRSESTAYGIKVYNESNEKIDDPLQHFIWALENGREYDTRFKGEFERIHSYLQGEDGKLTEEDIIVFGAVVTGDASSLKTLDGLPFIKASSIGVITDKY